MTRIIDTPKALLVEVPEGSWGFEIINIDKTPRLVFIVPDGFVGQVTKGFLPPGSYGQPILAGEMDGKMAEDIVEQDYFDGVGYQFANYDIERKWSFGMRLNNAAASFHSLLRSYSLNSNTTVVIPKI